MTASDEEVVAKPWSPGVLEVVLLVGLVVATTAMYAFGQLWPYFHNGFNALPYSQWATGAADPKDIWPVGTPLAGWVSTAGWLSLLAVPLVAFGAGLGAVAVGLSTVRQGRWTLAVVCALTVAACIALAAFHFGPLGQALTTWRLD